MGRTFRVRAAGIAVTLVVGLAIRADAQSRTPDMAPQVSLRRPPSASDSLYSSAERDFVVGKTVYVRSSKTLIGTIIRADPNHAFPKTFPRPHMKAVLIRRKDGPSSWTPVEGITRIYVVNRSVVRDEAQKSVSSRS